MAIIWTLEKKENFKKDYPVLNIEEICKKYNISKQTAWQKASFLKVKKDIKSISRKYKINKNYFVKIDSEDKAYILGFIAADGYNNEKDRVSIGIHRKDIEILNYIKNKIKVENPIFFHGQNNLAILGLYFKKMCKDIKTKCNAPIIKLKPHNNIFYLNYYGSKVVYRIYNYLYNDFEFCLKRKFNKIKNYYN